jgi:hypothetical protein
MPGAPEADALKFAIYQQGGWKPLAWWDFDILKDLPGLFRAEPLLAGIPALGSGSTELKPLDRTKTDTSKGIRTLNRRRKSRLLYRKAPPKFRS